MSHTLQNFFMLAGRACDPGLSLSAWAAAENAAHLAALGLGEDPTVVAALCAVRAANPEGETWEAVDAAELAAQAAASLAVRRADRAAIWAWAAVAAARAALALSPTWAAGEAAVAGAVAFALALSPSA